MAKVLQTPCPWRRVARTPRSVAKTLGLTELGGEEGREVQTTMGAGKDVRVQLPFCPESASPQGTRHEG